MYTTYFGLKEKPFKLVPNPAYLFLSRSHEEALAHLAYALAEGDGFLLITGEVGTGKTTLCRAFLERLEPSVEAALIFNPRLDAVQLLKAVNDEFEIDASPDTVKGLVDVFNAFLLRMWAAGRKVVVLIDEAQNLNREVLEQLRLLSNLESTRSKLLQIILVGQPELETLLATHGLRQLRQRISLACRLRPLGLEETRRYIAHRLSLAGGSLAELFSPIAIRMIHRFSGGVPRLINMACDRALLTAFGSDRPRVSGIVAWRALGEIRFEPGGRRPLGGWARRLTAGLAGALLLAGLVVGGAYLGGWQQSGGSPPQAAPPVPESRRVAVAKPPPQQQPPPQLDRQTLAARLQVLDPTGSRRDALAATLACWGGPVEIQGVFEIAAEDAGFFRLAALRNGFSLQRMEGALTGVQHFDLPVILGLRLPERDGLRYLSLTGLTGRMAVCRQSPERPPFLVPWADLAPFYAGVFYLAWKNPRGYSGVVSADSPRDKILALAEHLRAAGIIDADSETADGPALATVVRAFQRRQGLSPDGLVGPMTQLALYRATPGYPWPQPDPLDGRPEEGATPIGGDSP
jgi:general secretion pathway protein A